MRVKKVFFVVVMLIIFLNYSVEIKAAEEEKKVIYIVYDNSKSMVKKERDWGAQAQYAVKAFCAMSDPEDEIRFYCVSEFNDKYKEYDEFSQADPNITTSAYIAIEKTDDPQENRERYSEKLDEIEFNGNNTYYTSIHQAINDIKKCEGEKWVVMFTDGDIEDCENFEFRDNLYKDLENSDVNVCFVDLNPGKVTDPVSTNENYNLYTYRLAEDGNGSIIESILSVTEKIYGKRSLPKEGNYIEEIDEENGEKTLNIHFDIPVCDVVLLLQSQQQRLDKTTIDGCQWSQEIIGKQNDEEKGPYGVAAEFPIGMNEYQNKDDYWMSVNIPAGTSYTLYYTPIGELELTISQNNDDVKEGSYLEGEYSVCIDFINPVTGDAVDRNAGLLNIEKGRLNFNGEKKEIRLGEEILRTADVGVMELQAATTLGNLEDVTIQFEEDMKKYELHVTTEEKIFYYNRLEQKENAILLSVTKDSDNVTEKFKDMEPQVTFWQDSKECKDIICEKEYDYENNVWKIYPQLKNKNDTDISGNFLCVLQFDTEVPYYKEPINYYAEVELLMDAEEGLFDIEIHEGPINQLKLLLPWCVNKIPVKYFWQGEELKRNEVDYFHAVIEITNDKGEVFQKEIENDSIKIWGNINNISNQPREIQIRANAIYTAYGKKYSPQSKVLKIEIEEISSLKKITAILIVVFLLIVIVIGGINLVRILICIRKKNLLLNRLRVYRCYHDSDNWMPEKLKLKFKFKKLVILDYVYYGIRIKMPGSSNRGFLRLELKCNKDTDEIRIKGGGNPDMKLCIGGREIKDKYEKVNKKTEMILQLPENKTQRIRITQGEKL